MRNKNMYRLSIYLIIFSLVLFSSCEPKEKVVVITVDTTLTEVSIPLTSTYRYQKFFSLDGYETVSTNEKTDWDLGIRKVNNNNYIYLNSSRAMYAALSTLSFDELTSKEEHELLWDNPSGNVDSLVIDKNAVYLIDMGYDPELNHLGYKKIKLDGETLISADLDGSNQFEQSISFSNDLFITPISLSQSISENLFPASATWDFLFTQYTHQFDENTPYLVTGLLINPTNVEAQIDTTHAFADIDFAVASTTSFSSDFDAVGYDWKSYSIEAASYSMHYNKSYVVKTKDGNFYKLRFTDFYDDQGNKGEITFDIVRVVE